MSAPVRYSAEVAEARRRKRPLVALESTIITHGMPYPVNLDTARAVEAEIRASGAVPATMAVLDGTIRAGLEPDELSALAGNRTALKLSRADIAAAVATGKTGATTVAATMICARIAGIEVFATGGIGGVHRGAADSFDISADLRELSLTAVTVVAAGAKAILDIPKTLEVLETLGVPVIVFGQDAFPAFWSSDSGLAAPVRMDRAADIAEAHALRAALDLRGGQLVANPVPRKAEIPAAELAPMIERAVAEVTARGITGKAVTPYLLQRIYELSEGRSLDANISLVRNNARLAAEIAVALTERRP
ncbi:MAG: pseudouridine-5'-phosphate glycosidase [Paracoccaceae bacterium]